MPKRGKRRQEWAMQRSPGKERLRIAAERDGMSLPELAGLAFAWGFRVRLSRDLQSREIRFEVSER